MATNLQANATTGLPSTAKHRMLSTLSRRLTWRRACTSRESARPWRKALYHRPQCSYLSSIPLLLVSVLGAPVVAAAQNRGMWEMPMMQGGWGMVMILMMVLFWAAIVVVIIVGIRWLLTSNRSGRQTTPERQTTSALDVLKERYARGEISKQEFEEIRRDIQ